MFPARLLCRANLSITLVSPFNQTLICSPFLSLSDHLPLQHCIFPLLSLCSLYYFFLLFTYSVQSLFQPFVSYLYQYILPLIFSLLCPAFLCLLPKFCLVSIHPTSPSCFFSTVPLIPFSLYVHTNVTV